MTKRRLLLFLILAFSGAFVPPAEAQSEASEQIFTWVASQMKIKNPGKMPAIRYIDRQGLCAVFEKNNKRSYLRWKARYGVLQAQKILSVYLKEIMGLYEPDTCSVYVLKDLSRCRRNSILAHEFTHHFQYRNGIAQSNHSVFNKRFGMENQAYQIENRYMQIHCLPRSDN
jgi:hypothetical protein